LPHSLFLLTHALLALLALPLLEHLPALHNPAHNLRRIHVLELVIRNLLVDLQSLGNGVGVVGEGHELCDAVIYGGDGVGGGVVGEAEEEGAREGKGRAEDDGVDVLRYVSRD
jgi:hypothetical protein